MMNPVALSLLPEVGVFTLHPFNHHDRVIICGVAQRVEMATAFLSPMSNVTFLSLDKVMAFLILQVAVGHMFCLWNCHQSRFVDKCSIYEWLLRLLPWALYLSWRWFQLCTDQEVPKVLWRVISHDRWFLYGSFKLMGGKEGCQLGEVRVQVG